MSRFEIHPQLLHDCHRLGQLRLCHVLLHKNAAVPWLILVPETAPTGDLLDLPDQVRNMAMDEAAIAARFLKTEFAVSKINFAAIGNVVSQLHLHVVGRRATDPCWPAPVWGNLVDSDGYSSARIAILTATLTQNHLLKTF
ncbi:MAG TPA: HIT family protein [Candidatus Binatia bacterium]|nr:HIT family protein [Candidatus Binatia bacterium]